MESIKRKWGKPEVGVQLFMPNEYCAPCGDGTTMVTYEFWCNAGYGSYYVWEETNNIAGLQASGNGHDKCWAGPGLAWTSYHPCSATHSVTVPKGTPIDDIFPYGYISKNTNGSNNTQVRIWLDRKPDPVTGSATDVHCTTKLNTSEYTPHNPS